MYMKFNELKKKTKLKKNYFNNSWTRLKLNKIIKESSYGTRTKLNRTPKINIK